MHSSRLRNGLFAQIQTFAPQRLNAALAFILPLRARNLES
jgi:hypothetical protein